MSQAFIKSEALRLIEKHRTREPAQLAQELGIGIKYADIGTLKGFFTVILDQPFIVINQSLTESEARIVLAHELGHQILHEHLVQADGLRECILYDLSSKPEFEANLFAACLLLDEQVVSQAVKDGNTLREIAAAQRVDLPLIELFLRQLSEYN